MQSRLLNLRCWLSESCLRRSSLSCAVSTANLRCWLAESCLRRSSLSCAVSAANMRRWLAESCLRRSSLPCSLGCQPAASCLRRSSLRCSHGCQPALLVGRELSYALLSPVQSRLPTCAAGCQRVVLDAPLSPVQSRLLNLRCWLSESCLRRSSLSCAVSTANLRC